MFNRVLLELRSLAVAATGNNNSSVQDEQMDHNDSDDGLLIGHHGEKKVQDSLHVRLFGLDLRGLATLRILCSLLMLIDLWLRSGDITAFYTKDGIMPMEIYKHQKAYVYIRFLKQIL